MINVVIDTREQTPWHFDPAEVCVSLGTVPTGDYALVGDDEFAIERKSLDDFAGTIGSGWKRFCREIERMSGWTAKVIVVEGNMEQLLFREDDDGELVWPDHDHLRITPLFALKQIAALNLKGVAVQFAGDATGAMLYATALLKERAKQLEEGKQ